MKYLKRKVDIQLNNWYESGATVPLLVRGPRGVGKTSSVMDFAKKRTGQGYLYINFETDYRAVDIFNRISSIKEAVSEYFDIEEAITDTFLIILDEIQCCDSLIKALNGSKSDYSMKVIYLSSLMPEGRYEAVNELLVYPMDFEEYLDACGKSWYSEVIIGHFERRKQIPAMIFNELSDLYYEYIRLGGMPRIIADFIENESPDGAYILQREAYLLIMSDIYSYVGNEALRMKEIIETFPEHIVKKKLKFTPGLIRRGLTKNMFADAIKLLEDNGIIIAAKSIEDKEQGTILRFFDSGLLRYILASSVLSVAKSFSQDALSEVLTRNNVCNNISQKHKLYYWESAGQAKIECIFEEKNCYTPVDFDLLSSKKGKSIGMYQSIYKSERIYRVSNENFNFKEEIAIIPAFSAWLL